tara:strand:- start:905 stop:1273 length:369 start_codon:yes stop_codon:yes gene_type:complete
MASITLTFSAPLNVSCQVGDTAYYVTTADDGGFKVDDSNGVVEIGQIRQISDRDTSSPDVICDTILQGSGIHGATKFILFSKDNKANLSSILGYFASVKLVNNSTTEAELYSVGMDAFESSK